MAAPTTDAGCVAVGVGGVLANAGLDQGLVDIEHANAEMPPFPQVGSPAGVHTAFFFSTPGSVFRATHSGTWGDARESSVEYGERYLELVEAATVRMLEDVAKTFEAMPPR